MINLSSTYKHSILLALWLMASCAVAGNDTPASIRKEFRKQIRKNAHHRKQGKYGELNYYFEYGTNEYREFYRNGGHPVIAPHGQEAASIKDRLNLFNTQYEKDGITFYFFTASIFLDVERGEDRSNLKWEDIKEDFYKGTRIQSNDLNQRLETTKKELLINVLSQLSQEASINNAKKVIILFAVRSAIAYKDKDDKINYKFYVDRGVRTTGIDRQGQANLETTVKDSYESGTHSMANVVSAVAGYFGTYQLLQKYDDLVANTTTTRINAWKKSLDDAKSLYTGRDDTYLLYNHEEVTLSGEVEWKIRNLRYKLDVLSRKTDFRFFIVIQPVPFVIPKDSLNQYADDAHATLGLGDDDLLLTIPIYTTLALQKSPMRVEDFPLKMYGLSIGKNVKYDVLPTMSSLANLYENFLTVYKHLEKPYTLDVTYISYNGDVYHNNRGTSSQPIAGQENIYNYKLLVDTRLKEYHSLCSTYDGLRQSASLNTLASGENREPEFYEQKADEAEDQIIAYDKLAAAQSPEYHLVDHELWESSLEHLTDSVGYRFGYWYAYNSFKDIANTKRAYESPEDRHFISGKNPVLYEETLEAIDNLGLILAPFELDIVADLSGALYAGYYEDWATAGIYGVAVAVPGGIKLRQILRGGRFAGFKYLKNLHIQTEFGRAYTSVLPIIPVSIRTHLPLSVLEQLQTEEAIAFINKLREVKLSRSSAQALGEDLKSPALLDAFRKKPELVEAWQRLRNAPNGIRKGIHSLTIVSKWLNEGIEVSFEATRDGARILTRNGDEVGQLRTEGSNEVLEISDDFLASVPSSASKKLDGISINSNTGETLSNVGFVKNADGSIGFVEDVSGYGSQVVQSAIKKRGDLRAALAGIKTSEDAHHIIPVQLLKENEVVKKAVEAGFDFNGISNGLALEKFAKSTGRGRHGPHPNYTEQIRQALANFVKNNPGYTPNDAKQLMEVIINGNSSYKGLKRAINESTIKINELILNIPF
jgi:hypothetical protein